MDDAMLGKKAIILVVDDEPDVLEIETLLLADLGYEVIPSNSAGEALAIIAGGATVDMVLTDLVMLGDVDGWRLAERIREIRPQMKVAFTSGYVRPSAKAHIEAHGDDVLAKPWHLDELAGFLRRALGP
ncbi:MAG TPA: response regulator [Stellaceae bacterium]|nr:response regulator [Stellaceae bacterium]